jgi:hypothetical protein
MSIWREATLWTKQTEISSGSWDLSLASTPLARTALANSFTGLTERIGSVDAELEQQEPNQIGA